MELLLGYKKQLLSIFETKAYSLNTRRRTQMDTQSSSASSYTSLLCLIHYDWLIMSYRIYKRQLLRILLKKGTITIWIIHGGIFTIECTKCFYRIQTSPEYFFKLSPKFGKLVLLWDTHRPYEWWSLVPLQSAHHYHHGHRRGYITLPSYRLLARADHLCPEFMWTAMSTSLNWFQFQSSCRWMCGTRWHWNPCDIAAVAS